VLAAQWKADVTVTILKGDCRDVLATLPAESVHCVVTSPPYFGLRDYGVAGQIGLEDFASYIKNLLKSTPHSSARTRCPASSTKTCAAFLGA
jgi:DNA modification methylase